MDSYATESSIQMSGPGVILRDDAGAGLSRLGEFEELRDLIGAASLEDLESYYTATEVDGLLLGKSNVGHSHSASAITSGTIDTARLGSGTADNTTYLRGDSTWATIDLSTYVPYTGATQALNMGAFGVTAASATINGDITLLSGSRLKSNGANASSIKLVDSFGPNTGFLFYGYNLPDNAVANLYMEGSGEWTLRLRASASFSWSDSSVASGGTRDVIMSRNATGPKLSVRAAGGLEVRNLAGDADAPITASTLTLGGSLVLNPTNGAVTFGQTFAILIATSNAFTVRHGNSDFASIRTISGSGTYSTGGYGALAFTNISNIVGAYLTPSAAGTVAIRKSDHTDANVTCAALTASGTIHANNAVISTTGAGLSIGRQGNAYNLYVAADTASGRVAVPQNSVIGWTNTADPSATRTLGIAQSSAGVLEVNNGTKVSSGGTLAALAAGAATFSGTVRIDKNTSLDLRSDASGQFGTIGNSGALALSYLTITAQATGYPVIVVGHGTGVRIGDRTYTIDIKPIGSNSIAGVYAGQGTTSPFSGALAEWRCGALNVSGAATFSVNNINAVVLARSSGDSAFNFDTTNTRLSLTGTTPYIMLRDGASASSQIRQNGPTFQVRTNDGAVTALEISQTGAATFSGTVGIGTTVPDGTLHVHTASSGTVTATTSANDLVIENNSAVGMTFLCPNNQLAQIVFGDPDDNDMGIIRYNHSSDTMSFWTNTTERLTISSAGAATFTGTVNGRASTTAAGTAPIKLPTGVLMTTPEAGAIEYDGTNLYFTDSGGTRRQLQVV